MSAPGTPGGGGTGPAQPAPQTPLEAARATELHLREQIAELVSARLRAEGETTRLQARAGQAGSEPALAEVAERWRRQAERLGEEVEGLRAELRRQEARREELAADEAGV
jgi:predicted RNase H-like nuclease (RuvC/YqgF family)